MMTKDKRVELVQSFRTHDKNSGSPQVQVAMKGMGGLADREGLAGGLPSL